MAKATGHPRTARIRRFDTILDARGEDVLRRRMDNPPTGCSMVTEDAVLKCLDRPRRLSGILAAVDPGGRQDTLQDLLLRMRDSGRVRFDIRKGTWSRL